MVFCAHFARSSLMPRALPRNVHVCEPFQRTISTAPLAHCSSSQVDGTAIPTSGPKRGALQLNKLSTIQNTYTNARHHTPTASGSLAVTGRWRPQRRPPHHPTASGSSTRRCPRSHPALEWALRTCVQRSDRLQTTAMWVQTVSAAAKGTGAQDATRHRPAKCFSGSASGLSSSNA